MIGRDKDTIEWSPEGTNINVKDSTLPIKTRETETQPPVDIKLILKDTEVTQVSVFLRETFPLQIPEELNEEGGVTTQVCDT